MPSSDPYLLEQLAWWLRLPPTGMIERGDRIRFRHALYLMTHQMAGALLELNGQPEPLCFPSRLSNITTRLDALPVKPEFTGRRLTDLIGTSEPEAVWRAASELIRETLNLAPEYGRDSRSAPPDQNRRFRLPGHAASSLSALHHNRLAEETTRRLQTLDEIEAIALGGSVAHGAADQYSDVDLHAFCRSIPSPERRHTLFQTGLIEPACDTFRVNETLVHIRYWSSVDMDTFVRDTPLSPQTLLMGEETQNSVPLHDPHGRFADWKNRLTPLPQPVRKKIEEVSRHRRGAFEEIWKEAIEQGDLIHVYGLLCQAAHDWLIALHARNGWFLSTPRWSQRRMRTFDVIPFDARNRLLYIIGSVRNIQEAVRRWEELRRLWLELPAE